MGSYGKGFAVFVVGLEGRNSREATGGSRKGERRAG